MHREPYLSKSSYVGAHICERWLWKNFYNRPDHVEPIPGSGADIGNRVGALAQALFPDGVLVAEVAYDHQKALARTQELIDDPSVSAIFEAAVEHEGIRVRIDILERLEGGGWGIREVKSVGAVRKKTKYQPLEDQFAQDIAVQCWVARGAGLNVQSARYLYVNSDYVLDQQLPDPEKFFRQAEVLDELDEEIEAVAKRASQFLDVLMRSEEPDIEPAKSMCTKLGDRLCPFWHRCTEGKPEDWIDVLYRPGRGKLQALKGEGFDRLSELDPETASNLEQQRMIVHARHKKVIVETELAELLKDFPLPAIHLDFEYLSGVAWPLHIGTRPHQRAPFQFSAHRLNADLTCDHIGEYLAEGHEDPAHEFATRLVELLKGESEPIVAYAAPNAELPVLKDLIDRFPEMATDLSAIKDRVVDLAVVVRKTFMHPLLIEKAIKTAGSVFTLKSVAPALVPGFSYEDLGVVSQGGAAVEAYFQMVTGELPGGVTREALRASMLASCKKDPEATALVHKALVKLVT